MSGNDAVAAIRKEIDRKYSEALQALETLKAYFADTDYAQLPPHNGTPQVAKEARVPQNLTASGVTTVDRVLGAIANEYKTVAQLEGELKLGEQSIRAALYSKFVQSRITKKKVHNVMAFRRRAASPSLHRIKGEGSVAHMVRDHLERHPDGQTSGQIHAALTAAVENMGGSLHAIGAALYNMKKRGRVMHNEQTGIYAVAKSNR